MPSLDYAAASNLLAVNFAVAEAALLAGKSRDVPGEIEQACDIVFASHTQAYREVLLGCTLARLLDRSINIRQPYMKQGERAFNGRTLDERVVNPFLQEKRVPCTRGPYLSAFRRSVEFTAATRAGLRDHDGYDALLVVLGYLESCSDDESLTRLLQFVLLQFAKLREGTSVPLTRLHRISQEQFAAIMSRLLATPSGGRFPVLLAVAMFQTIKAYYQLKWTISWQGINVSDKAAGAGGDITVTYETRTILALEITEREVDRARVLATFQTKIAPAGLEDYLFLVGEVAPTSEALAQSRQYFAQGHEINFAELKTWILMQLVTMGKTGREMFHDAILALLDEPSVPQSLRAGWNEAIDMLTTS